MPGITSDLGCGVIFSIGRASGESAHSISAMLWIDADDRAPGPGRREPHDRSPPGARRASTCSSDWRPTGACSTSCPRRTGRGCTGPSPGCRCPSPAPGGSARGRRSASAGSRASARRKPLLDETGIRALRRRPVVTTPNVLPAAARRPTGPDRAARPASGPGAVASADARCCYVCKESYSQVHHFYDQLCPACADFNFAARTELADLRGRVALLTGRARQDRLPGGPQAASLRRAPDRHHALPAQRGDALRGRGRLRRLGPPAGDRRARPAPHAERGGVLPRPGRHARSPRLHRQQRLPDRPPPARVLRAHDGGGAGGASRDCPADARQAPARRRPAAGHRRSPRRPTRARFRCGRTLAGAAAARGTAARARTCSRTGAWTTTSSRSTCAATTPGGCCWPTSRPWSCSRCSW